MQFVIQTDRMVRHFMDLVAIDSPTYGLSFRQKETRLNFLTHALTSSELEAGIVPQLTDRILTLSTCTNQSDAESRRVVHARMEMIAVTVEQ